MKFIENIEKERYEEFVKNHKKSHFLQSYAWGEFSKVAKNFIPHYIGMVDKNDKILAAALLLEKKMPFGLSYLYSPRGYVIDFDDYKLLEDFTNYIKIFAKKRKAIFIKIDPDIIIDKHDYNDQEIKLPYDSNKYLNNLKRLGYKHLGFTKNFETNQPRYTFRIDMNNSFEEIENRISKTTKQRINKAKNLDAKVTLGTYEDLSTFHKLMEITENKKDFITHNLDYYQNLFKIYNVDNKFNLFLGSVNIKHIYEKLDKELHEINIELLELNKLENKSKTVNNKINELDKTKDKLIKDIEEYSKLLKEYPEEIILNGHAIIQYGDKAWVLYAGNHTILTNTNSNYNVYYEHLKYCYDNGIKTYDQFGTVGDLSKDNPRLGLHEFKKKFGGDYVEFIGEFDLVTNKPMYFVFTKLIPIYRNIIKSLAKKKRKSENN